MARLKSMWRDGKLSIKWHLRLMRAITMSVALYNGCETWTICAETERKLQAFEYRCLKKILRVPYTAHSTNTSIWDEVTQVVGPQEHLLAIVKRRKLTWYGHVNRSGGLANTILQGGVEGKRGRGRPRTTWLDNIRKWTGRPQTELHRLSHDRSVWRKITYSASQTRPLRSLRSKERWSEMETWKAQETSTERIGSNYKNILMTLMWKLHGRLYHRSWGGVMHSPIFSVSTVLTPNLPMHWPPTFKFVAPPLCGMWDWTEEITKMTKQNISSTKLLQANPSSQSL